jgi:hypothetical protein
MTRNFAEVVAVVSQLPDEQQDEIARLMLTIVENDEEAEEIEPAHLEGVMQGRDDIRHGRFASEADIEDAFKRFGA